LANGDVQLMKEMTACPHDGTMSVPREHADGARTCGHRERARMQLK